MEQKSIRRRQLILLAGDLIVLVAVTAVGFASHGTLGSAGERILATFVPLVAAWFMVAPFLGAYDVNRAEDLRQLWRPFWAMVLAGPMAALLRGFLLNSPILPIFVVVLGGISALSILGWRLIYALFAARKG
jgi:hypothetical protein